MSTLKDIHEVWRKISEGLKFPGVPPEALGRFEVLTRAANDAVMEEQGIDDSDKAAALSPDTVLGEKAEAVLADLKALFQEEW